MSGRYVIDGHPEVTGYQGFSDVFVDVCLSLLLIGERDRDLVLHRGGLREAVKSRAS